MTDSFINWSWRVIYLGMILVVIVLAATAVSSMVWVVDQDQRGVVLRYGKVERVVGPGLQFTFPYPMGVMEIVSTNRVFQTPVGFRLEDRDAKLPPSAEEVQWLTGDTNIVELQALVLWTVPEPVDNLYQLTPVAAVDDGFFDTWMRLLGIGQGRSDGSGENAPLEEVRNGSLVRFAAETALSQIIARMSVDDVLTTGKVKIQSDALDIVQRSLDQLNSGIRITNVNIVEAEPPPTVKRAFNDVASARSDKERKINEARGYALRVKPNARARVNRIHQEAEAYQSQILNAAQGEADGFEKLAKEAEKTPELVMMRAWLGAVERILARGQKIVVTPIEDGDKVKVYLGSSSD